MNGLEFLVLGPVVVASPGGYRSPGGPTTRAVLCALLLSPNRTVPAPRIRYDVWGDHDPGAHALQSHITRLRGHVGAERIVADEGGYRLEVTSAAIDSHRFEQLVEAARKAEDAKTTRERCLAAFELWRGVPFADLADRDFLTLEVSRLEEVRLHATEMCIEADLALGRNIIGALRGAVTEFPYHERLWAYLIRALDDGGRQPEALEAYHELEAMLEEELGIGPNEELQALRRHLVAG